MQPHINDATRISIVFAISEINLQLHIMIVVNL